MEGPTPQRMDDDRGSERHAAPASATLPARPVLRSISKWVDIQWPLSSSREIIAAGGAFTSGQMLKVGWKLVFCTFFLNVWGKTDGDIVSPFLNSRVHCCNVHRPTLPAEYDITSNASIAHYFGESMQNNAGLVGPDTTIIRACDVPIVPVQSPHWSLSGNCANKQFVLAETQKLKGWTGQVVTWVTICILPLGGQVGDCWGRRKVYFWTTTCLIIIALLYWLDCIVPGGDTHGPIFFLIAAVVQSGWAPHGPAGQAMVVDMMHSTRLGNCLPILQVVSQIGPFLGNMLGIWVVNMELENYSVMWGTLTMTGLGTLAFIWWGIFETLPLENRRKFEPWKWLKTYFLQFMLLKNDQSLMQIWFVIFLQVRHPVYNVASPPLQNLCLSV